MFAGVFVSISDLHCVDCNQLKYVAGAFLEAFQSVTVFVKKKLGEGWQMGGLGVLPQENLKFQINV